MVSFMHVELWHWMDLYFLASGERTHGVLFFGWSENLSDMAAKEEVPVTSENQNPTVTLVKSYFIE